jgi:DNA-binding NarL/FixJ family response regulator
MSMRSENELVVINGHHELYERTWHLFGSAKTELSCAANDLFTWAARRPEMATKPENWKGPLRVRKLFRPGVLLDPASTQHLRQLAAFGAEIRITTDEINETIVVDRRVAILAGDRSRGERTFSVVWAPDVVQAVGSLFDAAWRGGTDLAVYERELTELRALAPRILHMLGTGCKDETAARALSLSVRTYRRRVAELMSALGAESRFQAGVRARELGLV